VLTSKKHQRWRWLVIMSIGGNHAPFLYFFSIFLMLLFLGYEHWFVVLHGVLMLRSNVGDGALFS
jgi:hypothetical protein